MRSLLKQAEAPFPDALKTSFRGNLAAHRRDIIGALRDFRDAREEQQKTFTAATFDRTAAEVAQAKVRSTGEHLAAILQTALLDSVESLPDAQRRDLPQLPFGMRALRELDLPDSTGG